MSGVENKNKKDIKISLVIVSLNSSDYITNAIDSFLEQDYYNKELIIFDGMSTDGTHDIIKNYVNKEPNLIKWINNEKDCGISDARNKAIKHATGDYIGFLGADDRLVNNVYSEMNKYHHFCSTEYVDVIYFDSMLDVNNYRRLRNSLRIRLFPNIMTLGFVSKKTSDLYFNFNNIIQYYCFGPGEVFYYKKAIFSTLLFNIDNKLFMDYEFNFLLTKNNKKISFIALDKVGVINLLSENTVSGKNNKKQFCESINFTIYHVFKDFKILSFVCLIIFKIYSLFRLKYAKD